MLKINHASCHHIIELLHIVVMDWSTVAESCEKTEVSAEKLSFAFLHDRNGRRHDPKQKESVFGSGMLSERRLVQILVIQLISPQTRRIGIMLVAAYNRLPDCSWNA
jgi:hypothetical protein